MSGVAPLQWLRAGEVGVAQPIGLSMQQRRKARYLVRVQDSFGCLPLRQHLLQLAGVPPHLGVHS